MEPIEAKRKRPNNPKAGPSGRKSQRPLPPLTPVDPITQRPARTFTNPATQQLYDEGYVVINLGANDWHQVRKDVLDQLVCFQPLDAETYNKYLNSEDPAVKVDKDDEVDRSFSFGGFSALGTPDAFHCPAVRDLRRTLHEEVFGPLMRELARDGPAEPERKIECLFDRLMIREPPKKLGAESWHRDESKSADSKDIIMGGWVNLNDSESQYFSMIPRSHRPETGTDTAGFRGYKSAEAVNFRGLAQLIEIPANHILVFYQDAVHEVLGKKQAGFIQWRLFTGVRLTFADTPLIADTLERIEEQAPFPMKSGQLAPMFAGTHLNYSFHVVRLNAFTRANLVPELHERYTGSYTAAGRKKKALKEAKKAGIPPEEVDLSEFPDENEFDDFIKPKTLKGKKTKSNPIGPDKRQAPSLLALGLPLYPAYTTDELAIYSPQPYPTEVIDLT